MRYTLLLLSLNISTLFSQSTIEHSMLDKLLQKHVSSTGSVDYKNFKKDEKTLDQYLTLLSNNPPAKSWSKNERLAYWINVYNAFTIKKILKNYPLKSITDLNDGKPWDEIWIKIGKKMYSLNNIEHDILRKEFKEPRIHFALNCSAKSCPIMLNKAYNPTELDKQLEKQTNNFINDGQVNQIDANNMKLSKIFEWYSADFGDVRKFVNKYAKKPSNAKIAFKDYDWHLNEK